MHPLALWIAPPVAFLTSWLIVLGVRKYGAVGGLMDIPNERSSHSRATPRGGGLGIVAVTLVGLLLLSRPTPQPLAYIVAATLIAAISWLDDLRSLSNRVRLATHLIAALLVIIEGGWIEQVELPLLGTIDLGWWGVALSLFWLVGMTNIYNFMDGIDGIAGGQAVVAGTGWLLFGLASQNNTVVSVGLLIAASSSGFLAHNWSPAKIFMGDVGSAFLGFTFGWLGIIATRSDPSLALPALLVLWPFLFDATVTLARRFRRGENIFTAHRSHLYQKLVIAGQSHARVALLYSALSAVGVFIAWSAHASRDWRGMVWIIPLALALWYGADRKTLN